MKFAINYSPAAAALVQEKNIDIDYFKTPPWPDMIAEAESLRPVTVHFNVRAGDITLENVDFNQIETYLAHTPTAFVNIHLGIKPSEMLPEYAAQNLDAVAAQNLDAVAAQNLDAVAAKNPNAVAAQNTDTVSEMLLKGVTILTDHFGPENVIAENLPFHPNFDYNLKACTDPKIISEVIESTKCGLLLDISHARIAAHYLGVDGKEYIQNLPVHRLKELHFTGIHNWDGHLQDHLSIQDSDWPWLDWVIEQIRAGEWSYPHMLALEYGGTGEFFTHHSDRQVIAEQVPLLFKACHNCTI